MRISSTTRIHEIPGTYFDVDPFLLRKSLEFPHQDAFCRAFRHGERFRCGWLEQERMIVDACQAPVLGISRPKDQIST